MGDTIYANPIMLGYAWQRGWLPLSLESLTRAIELNGVAVEQNKSAFKWGRRMAVQPQDVLGLIRPAQAITFNPRLRLPLGELLQSRIAYLQGYQNAAYAQDYEDFVRFVQQTEEARAGALGPVARDLPLTRAIAENLFRLMAYKDEYEVARLHTDSSFLASIAAQFEGDYSLNYHLAPPLLAKRNAKGELQKVQYGSWVAGIFRLLAPLKVLRGGPLDVFGYSAERRSERALIVRYRRAIEVMLLKLNLQNYPSAIAIASLPSKIRGFGHVKERNLRASLLEWERLEGELTAETAKAA